MRKHRLSRSLTSRNAWLAAPLISAAVILAFAQPAYAVSCASSTIYEPGQHSVNSFYGVEGNISTPSAAALDGSASNLDDRQHMLQWLSEITLSPPAKGNGCGGGNPYCWVQVGVGMGYLYVSACESGPAENFSGNYKVYFEEFGAGGFQDCKDAFSNIEISQNSTYQFSNYYDGTTGEYGYPQFQTYILAGGQLDYIDEAELYYETNHVYADSEAFTGTVSTCPTMTNGSPYEQFGNSEQGGWDNGNFALQLQLSSGGAFYDWTGTSGASAGPYHYNSMANTPADFYTNGPS